MQQQATKIDRTGPHDGITTADLLSGHGLLTIDWSPMVRAERIRRACEQMDRERRAREYRAAQRRASKVGRVVAFLAGLLGMGVQ